MVPFLRTDVTSVCLHNDFILSGIGSNVYIFNKSTCAFLQKLNTLIGQKIHGFAARSSGEIIVYGGKQMCVVRLGRAGSASDVTVEKSDVICCDDWILHTAWTEENTIVVLTAHNVVQIWDTSTYKLISTHASKENSILYSGLLHLLEDDVLVFSGTVFSKVIIHRCRRAEPLQILEGHKGVIFSIAFEPTKELIVTTSDDRSVKIWGPSVKTKSSPNHKEYWEQCDILCRHTVYGHLSRVMRCTITPSSIVSVGEDSNVCFWDFSGKLLRKLKAHQNGCVWSVSSDETHVVTGGSDSGVILHPLSLALDYCQNDTLQVQEHLGVPKRLMFTARGNIVAYFSNNQLQYYDNDSKDWRRVASYDGSYKMIALSSCRQMVAVIDVNGNLNLFVESCKDSPQLRQMVQRKLDLVNVRSMHWAGNRLLAVCSEGGAITIVASDCENLRSFSLPMCKERWLTAVAVNFAQNMYVFGDRCGNLHFYHQEHKTPLKTFRKTHGLYGPTTIAWREDSVVTTGRDGTIKYFSVKDLAHGVEIKKLHQINLPFDWIERSISEDGLVCGFCERNFILYNIKDSRTIIDMACGGGHRAWDVNRYFTKLGEHFKEFVQFVYVKDSTVHRATFQLDNITSNTVVSGTHVKEINCLSMIPLEIDSIRGTKLKEVFFIAGGEDTTIRISSRKSETTDHEFTDRLIIKQLSSTRTIAYCNLRLGEILLVSGGGRANICIKVINFIKPHPTPHFKLEAENIAEYQAKILDRKCKGKTSWKSGADLDPETRIMCLQIVKAGCDRYVVLAGCSDSILRLFKYIHSQEKTFKPYGQINYHKTCILKVHCFETLGHRLAFTTTTTGEAALWDLSILIDNFDQDEVDFSDMTPILKLLMNKSGINSIAVNYNLISGGVLVATGGDDNSIHLILLKIAKESDLTSIFEASRCSMNKWHCAQVTGLQFVDDYLISASIDQRVTLSRCAVTQDAVKCEFVEQFYTDVADVQGLDTGSRDGDEVTICVYGKGIETMCLKIPERC